MSPTPADCPVRNGELAAARAEIGGVHAKVDDLRAVVSSLVEELKKLTRLEIDHSYTRAEVTTLTTAITGLRADIRQLDDKMEMRVAALERDLPPLIDLRRRVMAGVWSLVSMIAAALVATVIWRGK